MISVGEAKILRTQLEEGIAALLRSFESTTGLHVDRIDLTKVTVIGSFNPVNELVRVEVLL